MEPQVSIVIADWNTTKWMNQHCISAVRENTRIPHEVIVVNSGSEDASQEEIAMLADLTIHMPTNLGPSAAWNAGVQIARAPYLCILNSDAQVDVECIDRMALLAGKPKVGLVGCMSNNTQTHSKRTAPVVEPDFRVGPGGAKGFVAFVNVVIPRRVYDDVGPFDERFRRGQREDADYNLRLRDKGYEVWVAGNAFCWHAMSLSYRVNKVDVRAAQQESRRAFDAKWHGRDA